MSESQGMRLSSQGKTQAEEVGLLPVKLVSTQVHAALFYQTPSNEFRFCQLLTIIFRAHERILVLCYPLEKGK